MVKNAAEGKEIIRSVNAEQSCSRTELLIVGDSDKLVCLTSGITALSNTKLHFIALLRTKLALCYTCTTGISRNLSKKL